MYAARYDRPLAWAAAIGLCVCVLGALYATLTWHSWPAARFLVLYVAPMVVAAPWWIRVRIRELGGGTHVPRLRVTVDVLVFLLAAARFGVGERLPFSGHMLFLTYTLLTTRDRAYRWLALGLLAETSVFKLWLWSDPRSWSIGLLVGAIAALMALVVERRERR